MGCSVVWSYYDLFGPERLARLILAEGQPSLTRTPGMSERDAADASALFDAAASALMFDHSFNDWRDVIPRITMPTLVIGGGRSHIPLSAQRWLHRTIRGSRLEVLEDQGHLLLHEDPKNFNEVVARFMDATTDGRA
jgi:non-heme chloroperoxidase